MRRVLGVLAVVSCATLCSGAYYISETQAIVQSGLSDLEFQMVESKGGLIGAPTRFKITPKTIKNLLALMKAGKEITVSADGKIEVVETAKPAAKEVE